MIRRKVEKFGWVGLKKEKFPRQGDDLIKSHH